MSSVWKVHLSSLVCAVNENVPTLPFELKANIDSHKRNFNLRRGFLACGRYVNKKDFFFPSSKWEKDRRPWWEMSVNGFTTPARYWVKSVFCSASCVQTSIPFWLATHFLAPKVPRQALELSRQSTGHQLAMIYDRLENVLATAKATDRVNWQRLAIKSTKYVVNMIYVFGEKRTPFIKWETLF